jgi:hypothetical protein
MALQIPTPNDINMEVMRTSKAVEVAAPFSRVELWSFITNN